MEHLPVLLEETVALLVPQGPAQGSGVVVDCTVGLGGHAQAVLERRPDTTLVAIDRDPQALAIAAQRLEPFGQRVRWVPGDFREIGELLGEMGIDKVAGILADLGVSSLQLETAERGFSFRLQGPLDMRMGAEGRSAAEIVNRYSETDLERIFREYGEERQARRIARAVVRSRSQKEIATTAELRAIILDAKRNRQGRVRTREGRIDPATRVFQALRMEVNEELAGLRLFMKQTLDLLDTNGRLVVISYHSLEDRIVKNVLKASAQGRVDLVTGRPLAETRLIEILTRKPVRPGLEEVQHNPRSRSARLRAARRL